MWITVSWLRFLPVSRTVTAPTLASWNFRIPEEIIRTDVTAFTSVAGVTVADRLAGTLLQVTAFSVGVLWCLYIRTRTGTTRNLVFSQYWISKISNLTSLTKTEIKGIVSVLDRPIGCTVRSVLDRAIGCTLRILCQRFLW